MKDKSEILKHALKFARIVGSVSCLYAGPTLVAWIGWPTDWQDQVAVSVLALAVLVMSLGFGTGDGGLDIGGSSDGGGDGGCD